VRAPGDLCRSTNCVIADPKRFGIGQITSLCCRIENEHLHGDRGDNHF